MLEIPSCRMRAEISPGGLELDVVVRDGAKLDWIRGPASWQFDVLADAPDPMFVPIDRRGGDGANRRAAVGRPKFLSSRMVLERWLCCQVFCMYDRGFFQQLEKSLQWCRGRNQGSIFCFGFLKCPNGQLFPFTSMRLQT
ncbi:hypothetical protein VTJ04DRAFT_2715 [Mycothermus thermophilus]|uniref:uncharacterized protein n=1 Tax=Humicola insolens TaxID=85995 RepID=UPI003744839A